MLCFCYIACDVSIMLAEQISTIYSKKKVKKATGWVVLLIITVLVGLIFVLKYLVN